MAQVSIISSTVIANRDKFKPNDLRTAGRNFQKRGLAKSLAADSIGSMYGFFALPAIAVITSVEFSCAAMGTSCTFDIGVYQTKARGGFSATTGWLGKPVTDSQECFVADLDVSGALAKHQCLFANTAFYTLALADQTLWKALGLTSDPGAGTPIGDTEYDMVATVTAATVNASDMLMEISYKME